MNSNNHLPRILISLAAVFFLTAAILAGTSNLKHKQNIISNAQASTVLSIYPPNQSRYPNESFDFKVLMDTGSNHVTGMDLILDFDISGIYITGIEKGSGIPAFENVIENSFDNSAGNIFFTTFTLDRQQYVNGNEIELLVVHAKTNANTSPGNYQISFNPATAVSATNETTSVLTGTTNAKVTVQASPTNPPTPTIVPTGVPNSCGGTCGSNSNCQTGLFCYNGYCRNPSCTSSTSCVCYSATNVPTSRPRPTASPAPDQAVVFTPTNPPSLSPSNISTPLPSDSAPSNFWERIYTEKPQITPLAAEILPSVNLPESVEPNIIPWVVGSLTVGGIAFVLIALGILKYAGFRKKKTPVIKL